MSHPCDRDELTVAYFIELEMGYGGRCGIAESTRVYSWSGRRRRWVVGEFPGYRFDSLKAARRVFLTAACVKEAKRARVLKIVSIRKLTHEVVFGSDVVEQLAALDPDK